MPRSCQGKPHPRLIGGNAHSVKPRRSLYDRAAARDPHAAPAPGRDAFGGQLLGSPPIASGLQGTQANASEVVWEHHWQLVPCPARMGPLQTTSQSLTCAALLARTATGSVPRSARPLRPVPRLVPHAGHDARVPSINPSGVEAAKHQVGRWRGALSSLSKSAGWLRARLYMPQAQSPHAGLPGHPLHPILLVPPEPHRCRRRPSRGPSCSSKCCARTTRSACCCCCRCASPRSSCPRCCPRWAPGEAEAPGRRPPRWGSRVAACGLQTDEGRTTNVSALICVSARLRCLPLPPLRQVPLL